MMLHFIVSNLKDEDHQFVYEIIQTYLKEHGEDDDDDDDDDDKDTCPVLEKKCEDLNYIYFDVKHLPIKLLKMIYKFISFSVESKKVDKQRIVD